MFRRLTTLLAAIATAAYLGGAAQADTPKDTLMVAQDLRDIITFDPSFTYDQSGNEIVTNLYDNLVLVDPDDIDNIRPWLAQSWVVGEDGATITFQLREGVIFHSGNPLTSEDVAYSLRRTVFLDGLQRAFLDRLGWTKENFGEAVEVVDPLTIRFRIFTGVSPSFALINLGTVVTAVVDRKLVMQHEKDGDMGSAWLKSNDAGSGPFRLESYRPTEGIVLKAVADHPLAAPKLNRVIIRHVPEPSSQRLLLESGDVDIARNLPRDQLNALDQSGRAVAQSNRKMEMVHMSLNSSLPVLGHSKVQEALRYLIDYQGMEQSFLKGDMAVAQTFWPFGNPTIPNIYTLDVEKAKGLLKEAGYPDGFKVKLDVYNTAPWMQIGQSIKATMAKAGVDVELVTSERKAVATKFRSRDFEMVIHVWTADYMHPDAFSSFYWSPEVTEEANLKSQVAWRTYWRIPAISMFAEIARAETDGKKRDKMYTAIQYAVQQESPIIFLFNRSHQNGVSTKVRNFMPGPTFGVLNYSSVYKE